MFISIIIAAIGNLIFPFITILEKRFYVFGLAILGRVLEGIGNSLCNCCIYASIPIIWP